MSQKGFAAFALPFIALALPAANPFTNTVTSVHCETPGGVLMSGEVPALRLHGVDAANLAWTLEDWRGRLLEAGAWPASGRLVLRPLPPGYYRVAVRARRDNEELCGILSDIFRTTGHYVTDFAGE